MNKSPRQNNTSRQKLLISFFLASIIFLYWGLNQIGYLPPVNYLLSLLSVDSNFPQNSLLPTPQSNKSIDYHRPVAEIIPALDKSQTAILIEKSQYRLTLYYQNRPIKSYPVVFGGNPQEDKLKEGDFRTPEGVFKIRDLYPHGDWSKFIWIDYPNQNSWRKHLQAKKEGKIPYFSRIGSEIGIHGVPANSDSLIDERNNWTWGCISLKNKDIDELYSIVTRGTMVMIIP